MKLKVLNNKSNHQFCYHIISTMIMFRFQNKITRMAEAEAENRQRKIPRVSFNDHNNIIEFIT